MITGLNHITFAVKDLEKSFYFYKDILGFQPLMKHSKGAYFLAGDCWFCLDLDPNTRLGVLPEYTHFAFSISEIDFEKMSLQIKNSHAPVWKENISEGDSLYFLDPDGHKLEMHVGDWKSRIEAVKKKPWSESIEFFSISPMLPDVDVRAAKKSEAKVLSGLAMRSKSYWPYTSDYLEKCIGVLHVTEEDILQWPVFVAERKDEVLGFFALKKVGGENRLDHLWIDPRFIGKGIGKLLFTESIDAAKKIGWSLFRIAADPYAEPFYLKMGAKNIGSVQSRIKPDLFLPHLEMKLK
jgi:catechol 2,3-dioxygenase-like lactoylglutathione lyase family enzyme/GNAT superfamily N-acetyltransferase